MFPPVNFSFLFLICMYKQKVIQDDIQGSIYGNIQSTRETDIFNNVQIIIFTKYSWICSI